MTANLMCYEYGNNVTQRTFTCSELTIEKLEQGVNFENIQHLILLLTLNM